jgi:putative endonuclease
LNSAERRAARWYRLRGWRIIGANVWSGGNEVDLIARRGRELRFVEVKEKTGPAFGEPAEMVDVEKQRRVRRAAELWLADRPDLGQLKVAFDVVSVHQGRLRRIPDAFLPDLE